MITKFPPLQRPDMNNRSINSTVRFWNPFTLPGYPDEMPAGEYEVIVEEELLQGLSFAAYRRTATYLTVRGKGRHAGRTELRAVFGDDLNEALTRDQAIINTDNQSDAALSPQEDFK